ncbi:Band 4.1-like protein 4 [Amphibalanus amphitrite]|uniref:Band 4.1-like protein 4 n=1 Tax=Amphibalanus amphitrite TaxID=1232801 RepID=A0A6A4V8U7_AMPAM|nr:Band 4.1-like protein 4 [Amphibalanus amphitrite]
MNCFRRTSSVHSCSIVLLDGTELSEEIRDDSLGQELLDVVLRRLGIHETSYFGLRYVHASRQPHWLNPNKKVHRQLKGTSPFTLYFCVKYYATDPCKLRDEITRYQFFLQVKKDIVDGRLPVPQELSAELSACVAQSELGDFEPSLHGEGYCRQFQVNPMEPASEQTISALHRSLKGRSPAEAEAAFLEKVRWLDMYGTDLYPVMNEEQTISFRCASRLACQLLLQSCLDQQEFFRQALVSPPAANGSRGATSLYRANSVSAESKPSPAGSPRSVRSALLSTNQVASLFNTQPISKSRSRTSVDSQSSADSRTQRRHHAAADVDELIDSEPQWREVQRLQAERLRPSGYQNSGMETETELSYQPKRRVKRHSRSRSRSRSPETNRNRRLPVELRRHLQFGLVEPPADPSADLQYTRVTTEHKMPRIRYAAKRSQKGESSPAAIGSGQTRLTPGQVTLPADSPYDNSDSGLGNESPTEFTRLSAQASLQNGVGASRVLWIAAALLVAAAPLSLGKPTDDTTATVDDTGAILVPVSAEDRLDYKIENDDGTYQYGYQSGRLEDAGGYNFKHEFRREDGVLFGQHGYQLPGGESQAVNYVADARGYRVVAEGQQYEPVSEQQLARQRDLLGDLEAEEEAPLELDLSLLEKIRSSEEVLVSADPDVALAPSPVAPYSEMDPDTGAFRFGFRSVAEDGSVTFRQENRRPNGVVVGQYGFRAAGQPGQLVSYVSDAFGYREVDPAAGPVTVVSRAQALEQLPEVRKQLESESESESESGMSQVEVKSESAAAESDAVVVGGAGGVTSVATDDAVIVGSSDYSVLLGAQPPEETVVESAAPQHWASPSVYAAPLPYHAAAYPYHAAALPYHAAAYPYFASALPYHAVYPYHGAAHPYHTAAQQYHTAYPYHAASYPFHAALPYHAAAFPQMGEVTGYQFQTVHEPAAPQPLSDGTSYPSHSPAATLYRYQPAASVRARYQYPAPENPQFEAHLYPPISQCGMLMGLERSLQQRVADQTDGRRHPAMAGPRCRITPLSVTVAAVVLVVLPLHTESAAVQSADEPPSRPPLQRPSMLQPVFLNTTRHVQAPVGRPAYLHCIVQHPGDRTISWVRRKDLHILTVGEYTYSSDQRFQSLHVPGTQEWTLKVRSPTPADSGVYDCQVSTEPRMSLAFQLDVTVSQARILGSPELHVKTGSDVNLTCEVAHNTRVFYWYHNGDVINHSGRPRLRLETEPTVSRLYITRMTANDTGTYTCGPSGAEPASVVVHAINGGHPAAMQHNSAGLSRPAGWPLLIALLWLPLLVSTVVAQAHSGD